MLVVYGVLVVLAGVVVVSTRPAGDAAAELRPPVQRPALLRHRQAGRVRRRRGQLREIAGTLNYGRLVGLVSGLLLGLTSLLGNLVFLLSLLLFLSIEASGAGTGSR